MRAHIGKNKKLNDFKCQGRSHCTTKMADPAVSFMFLHRDNINYFINYSMITVNFNDYVLL